MAEADSTWKMLGTSSRSDDKAVALRQYNEAVEKLFDQLRCGTGDWKTRAAAMGSEIDRSVGLADPDALDAVVDLDQIDFGTLKNSYSEAGLGVVAVGWKETTAVGVERGDFMPPNGDALQLTVLLDFDEEVPVWRFYRRYKENTTKVGVSDYTLTANWTAPNAFYWKMCQLDDMLLQNVFLPDRFTDETGLYFLEDYDPGKIPIVFVHGLVSSPDAFKNVLNALYPEKWFRDRYQVWLYNYPTGNPWIYSAIAFRENIREAVSYAKQRGGGKLLDEMVVVCHSMGGLVTRCSVTDPQNTFIDEIFDRPFDQMRMSAEQRKLVKDSLLHEPLTEPKRVVFMATPHRGSPMAIWGPSAWVSRFIRLPKNLTVNILDKSFLAMTKMAKDPDHKVIISSINSLSPKSQSIVALNKLPLPKHIRFHSIVGDRRRGDTPDSSDGVVPYWSSHIEPVESEEIVDSNHGVPDNPEAALELVRILKLHLEEQ